MSGFGSATTATGTFPNRKTYIDFNDYLSSVAGQWVFIARDSSEMCKSSYSSCTNAVFINGVGFTLKSYHLDPGDSAWLSAAQPGILSPTAGEAVAGGLMTESNVFAQQSLSGVTYNATVQAAGTPMLQTQVNASASWAANNLSGDQTAFPGPIPSEDSVTLDRVFYSPPGTAPIGSAYVFTFFIPNSALRRRGTIAVCYFNAGASFDASAKNDPYTLAGTGQYALKIRNDGRGVLYELLNDGATWRSRFNLPNMIYRGYVDDQLSIAIVPRIWTDQNGHYNGDRISFLEKNLGDLNPSGGYSVIDKLTELANYTVQSAVNSSTKPLIYNIPQFQQQAIVPCGVRVDVARDVRAKIRVEKAYYRSPGFIIDDYFRFDAPLTGKNPVYLYWFGVLPGGCSWDATMYDENGNALSVVQGTTTVNGPKGQTAYKVFTPSTRMTGCYVQFEIVSDSSTTLNPIIANYQVAVSPDYTSTNPLSVVTIPQYGGNLAKQVISSTNIMPQQIDPGTENAVIEVEDYTGDLAFLGQRAFIPIRVYTTYDTTPGHYADLFRGYITQASAHWRRHNVAENYPNQKWAKWTLTCAGEWAKFYRMTLPTRLLWDKQPPGSSSPGGPWYVTDVIRELAASIYPPSMVQVPNFDIQLFSEDPFSYMSDVGTRQADICQELAADYLGAYMLFDESAGSKGMLRMLPQKYAPYNNLATFTLQHPTALAGDAIARLPQMVGSYPYTTSANGQKVQTLPIEADTFDSHYEAPEGNAVITYGCAVGDDASAGGMVGSGLLTQVAYNVGSYNFLNLGALAQGYPNGSSPDYLGFASPIRVFDAKLSTQEAVDWKTRRVYDRACFARYFLRFRAPLELVTDVTDAYQSKPRRLRFYDAVTVNLWGTVFQFIVVSCTPTIHKDSVQQADYVLVTQANINTIGVIPEQSFFLQKILDLMSRKFNSEAGSRNFVRQKNFDNAKSTIVGLPLNLIAPPIQDLNPLSATFGQFYGMVGYDAVDSGIIT